MRLFLFVQINFILFISIIRILVQKLRCTDVGGNEQSQYRCTHVFIIFLYGSAAMRSCDDDLGT